MHLGYSVRLRRERAFQPQGEQRAEAAEADEGGQERPAETEAE
jgi:hypothetical protein